MEILKDENSVELKAVMMGKTSVGLRVDEMVFSMDEKSDVLMDGA